MNEDFINALNNLQEEKNIDKEELLKAIETSIKSAYQRNYRDSTRVDVTLDRDTGEITVYEKRNIVENVVDPKNEISIEEVKKLDPTLQVGDVYMNVITPKDFGRIAAQNAKQLIIQKIKDAERAMVYDQYIDREEEMINGTITRFDKNNALINIGTAEGILPVSEQIKDESYTRGQRIKTYIVSVKKSSKGSQIRLSRTHPGLVTRLFEEEVPEIYNGQVQIIGVSREAGSRTKIAVTSAKEGLDAVGACVGPKGTRVQSISDELNGEKIDIVRFSKDNEEFIANALSPAQIEKILINPQKKRALVVVDDFQLSLAIGKDGLNVKLAAKLTGWKIDIKSTKEFQELLEENPNFEEEFTEAEAPDLSDFDEDDLFIDEDTEVFDAENLLNFMEFDE